MADEKRTAATSVKQVDGGSDDHESLTALRHADDALLAKLGYRSEFKREFSVSLLFCTCIPSEVLLLTDSNVMLAIRNHRVRLLDYGRSRLGIIHNVVSPRIWSVVRLSNLSTSELY